LVIVKRLSIYAGGCGSASDGCVVFTGIANKDFEKAERRSRMNFTNKYNHELNTHPDNTTDHAGKISKNVSSLKI
jgi:hypothetical protein